jgi:hypothetical protein
MAAETPAVCPCEVNAMSHWLFRRFGARIEEVAMDAINAHRDS